MEVEESLVVPPAEARAGVQYRALTLVNGLRVLLVSDPHVAKAAAALNVHAGSFQVGWVGQREAVGIGLSMRLGWS